jgi:hypothetical protein
MPQTKPRIAAPEWTGVLRDLRVAWATELLILGDRADLVAAAYQRAGAPPSAYAREKLAYLTDVSPAPSLDDAVPGATGLPAGSVGLVVLRQPWSGLGDCGAVIDEAFRILRPGGGVVAAVLDWGRLIDASSRQYPSRLLYRLRPDVAASLRRGAVTPADLGMLVTRRFRNAVAADVDESLATYPDLTTYRAGLRRHGWRGLELLEDAAAAAILETAVAGLAEITGNDPVVEREPWRVLYARKPS